MEGKEKNESISCWIEYEWFMLLFNPWKGVIHFFSQEEAGNMVNKVECTEDIYTFGIF